MTRTRHGGFEVGDAGELSVDLVGVAPLSMQRAAFVFCAAIDEDDDPQPQQRRLLALIDLCGPEWLDLIGRLHDALWRHGGQLDDLLDPDRFAALRGRLATSIDGHVASPRLTGQK
jgi:hypothetical protein